MKTIDWSEVKPGMIGQSGGDAFIQKKIRFFTGDEFSHTFLTMHGPGSEPCVLETTSTIVKLAPLKHKKLEPDWVEMWEIVAPLPDIYGASLETFAEYVGSRYGYESYLWFMYRWGVRKLGREPKKMWDWASKGVTCTELTCYTISRINEDFAALLSERDYNTYAPHELKVIMQNNPDKFINRGWLVVPPWLSQEAA